MFFWLRVSACLFGAAGLTAILTPGAIRLAPLIGAMDIPKDRRRMHTKPMPRCGGLAIFGAFLLCSLLPGIPEVTLMRILWGATVIVVFGILDDIFRLSAPLKLTAQLFAVMIAIGEVGTPRLILPVIFCLAMINAHNMMDGLDGLLAGIAAVEGTAMAIAFFVAGNMGAGMMTLTIVGCCLGYYPYNRHPARLFMGDTGSQFLGYSLAVLSLHLRGDGGALTGWIPLLIFALPLSDLVFAVIRRLLKGKNPFLADRGHWHHRLMDTGMGQRRAVAWLVWLSASVGVIGVLLCREEWYGFAVYATLAVIGWILMLGGVTEKAALTSAASDIDK